MKNAAWARLQSQKSVEKGIEKNIRFLKDRIESAIVDATKAGLTCAQIWIDDGYEEVAKEFVTSNGYTCSFITNPLTRTMTITW